MTPHTHARFGCRLQLLGWTSLVACWMGLVQPVLSRAHDLKPGDVLVGATTNGFPTGYLAFGNDGQPVLNADGSQHRISDPNSGNELLGGFFHWSDRRMYAASSNIYGFGPDDLVLFNRSPPHEVAMRVNMNQFGIGRVQSIDRDKSGNIYVGALLQSVILKFSHKLEFIKKFDVAPSLNTGVHWMDVTDDGSVIFYTNVSHGLVFRFDTVNEIQLPGIPMDTPEAQNPTCVKLLPPFDGSGGLLVSKTSFNNFAAQIYRIDLQGTILQLYDLLGEDHPTSLDLDPNGRSFWVTTASSNDQTEPGGLLRIKLSGNVSLRHRFDTEVPNSVVVVGNRPLWTPPDWPWRK